MKFFKENSYDIVKLFINQIGIAIFSMMLYSSISLIDLKQYDTELYLSISIFSLLFYFVLIYSAAWEFGAKDRIKVDSGKYEKKKFKGGLLAVYANIPNFLIVGLALIFKTVHLLGGPEGFNTAFVLLNNFFRLLMSIYLGIIKGVFSFVTDVEMSYFYQAIGYMVIPVFVIAVSQLAYTMGYNEKRFSNLILGKNEKK